MVNDMVNYLAKELGIESDNGMETLRQSLCDGLQAFCSSYQVLSILTGRRLKATSAPPAFGSFEKLVSALSLGHHHLVRALVQRLPSLAIHPVFGAPLLRATDLKDEAAVKSILDGISMALANRNTTVSIRDAIQMEKPLSRALCPERGFGVGNAMYTVIYWGHANLLSLLVTWYTDHGFTLFKNVYNHFLDIAIENSSLAIVKAVLDIPFAKYGSAKKVTWTQYRHACVCGRKDVVKLFLDDGCIDANDKVSATSPLFEAVLSGRLSIVKTLVEAGADVNQESIWCRTKQLPIMIAIKKQNFAIIRYLLDMGSNLPGISTWPGEWKYTHVYDVL